VFDVFFQHFKFKTWRTKCFKTLNHCRETVTMLGLGHALERLFHPLEEDDVVFGDEASPVKSNHTSI